MSNPMNEDPPPPFVVPYTRYHSSILASISDPLVTKVNLSVANAPERFGAAVGAALLRSENIEQIECLNLASLFSEDNTKEFKSLCKFVWKSSNLHCVEVDNADGRIQLATKLFVAMARNPHITEVTLRWNCHVPMNAVSYLLRNTKSLKTFNFTLLPDPNLLFPRALRRNVTLEKLTLTGGISPRETNTVLRNLGSHKVLRELNLQYSCFNKNSMKALAVFLRATQSLDHIVIRLPFNGERMKTFVEALRCNKSLDTLTLDYSTFDGAAVQHLLDYMMSTKDCASGRMHCISQLRFNLIPGERPFATHTLQQVFVPMMFHWSKRKNGPTTGSIGSSLLELSFQGSGRICDLPRFFDLLRRHASDVKLRRLSVERINRATRNAAVKCIPHLVHLKDLTLRLAYPEPNNVDFLTALRQNGSLTKLTIEVHGSTSRSFLAFSTTTPLFQQSDATKVLSYLKRNENAPLLLSDYPLLDPSTNGGKGEEGLFPALMAVATQTPRIAPSTILTGLFSLEYFNGPVSDGKRRLQE